jgi:hypothetical protein
MFDLTEGSSDSIDVDPHLNRGEARNITSSIEDAHIVDRQILYKMIRVLEYFLPICFNEASRHEIHCMTFSQFPG